MIYFTADLHFEHANIIDYCRRPYKNTNIMRKQLIKNWNNIVTENDLTYIVGDFSMEEPRLKETYKQIMKKLNGEKILIIGNHDIDKVFFYIGNKGIGFQQIAYPYLEVEEFIVCHDPTLSLISPDKPFITGHVHQMWHTLRNCYNCGVDVNNYEPVSITTIRKHFNKIKI